MFVWIACTNDGASISKSKQSLKKIIQELRGMYLFIFCTQFWISFGPNICYTLLWSVFQWAVLTSFNRYLSNLLGRQKFPFVIGLQRNGSVLSFFGTRNSWNAFNSRGKEQKLVVLLFLRNKRQNLRKKICFYVDPDQVLIFYFCSKKYISKKASFREWKQRTREKAIPDELLSCFWLRKGYEVLRLPLWMLLFLFKDPNSHSCLFLELQGPDHWKFLVKELYRGNFGPHLNFD